MPTIPAGYIEATFIFRRSGASRDSTWTHGYDDAAFNSHTPYTQALDLYTAFANGTNRPYHPNNMQASWQFKGVQVTKMLESGPLTSQFLGPINGVIADTAMPPNVAVLVNKHTAAGGRRNRGRFFLPPVYPPEGNVDSGGTITATPLGNLDGWYSNANTAAEAAGYTRVLFHSKAPFTPTEVTFWSVEALVATQRRRLRK